MKDYFSFHGKYADQLHHLLINEGVMVEVKGLITLLKKAKKSRKTVYFCGNGGHAATSNHFATDLSTIGIKAVSLTANSAEVTRLGNDFGYERVFDKQLENMVEEGDIVVGISASGNSMNVVKALEMANQQRAHSVALVGFGDGGKAKDVARHCIHVQTRPGMYGIVEDAHMTLCHMIAVYFKKNERILYS